LPDWLIERGIGETRFARLADGAIAEARIVLDGLARAGEILDARLTSARRPAVATAGGEEYLLPGGAPGATQGAAVRIQVTRERIPGAEPWKRPLAKLAGEDSGQADAVTGASLAIPAAADWLEAAGWSDLMDEARTGIVRFPGGELRISPTPAMTLIDVDGFLSPRELALLGAEAAARAILRLDIGGSIGVDLPTIAGKADRQAVGEAIDAILPRPFERTAMNGFGFVQIVRSRRRASLVELAQDRAAFEARALLRRTAFEPAGAKHLVAHPALIAVLESHPDWIEALARQTGGGVALRADAARPMSGGYAEPV
jgi:ribonuclease G